MTWVICESAWISRSVPGLMARCMCTLPFPNRRAYPHKSKHSHGPCQGSSHVVLRSPWNDAVTRKTGGECVNIDRIYSKSNEGIERSLSSTTSSGFSTQREQNTQQNTALAQGKANISYNKYRALHAAKVHNRHITVIMNESGCGRRPSVGAYVCQLCRYCSRESASPQLQ